MTNAIPITPAMIEAIHRAFDRPRTTDIEILSNIARARAQQTSNLELPSGKPDQPKRRKRQPRSNYLRGRR